MPSKRCVSDWGVGLGNLWRPLPTQTIPWLYYTRALGALSAFKAEHHEIQNISSSEILTLTQNGILKAQYFVVFNEHYLQLNQKAMWEVLNQTQLGTQTTGDSICKIKAMQRVWDEVWSKLEYSHFLLYMPENTQQRSSYMLQIRSNYFRLEQKY